MGKGKGKGFTPRVKDLEERVENLESAVSDLLAALYMTAYDLQNDAADETSPQIGPGDK